MAHVNLFVYRHKDKVLMKVLSQSHIRSGLHIMLLGNEHYRVMRSYSCPELSSPNVYVCGDNNDSDHTQVPEQFDTVNDADEAAKDIIRLMAKANGVENYDIDVRPIYANPYEAAINGTANGDDDEIYVYILVPTVRT